MKEVQLKLQAVNLKEQNLLSDLTHTQTSQNPSPIKTVTGIKIQTTLILIIMLSDRLMSLLATIAI